jgi:1,4-alpha-glucan branching enzyme
VLQPEARSVHAVGDFNGWDPARTSLQQVSSGVWTVTLPLTPGRYEYMFVVDGQRWVSDPAAVEQADDGFGARNAVLECCRRGRRYEERCLPYLRLSPPSSAFSACSCRRRAPRAQPGAARHPGRRAFSVDQPAAHTVAVAGTFNGWSVTSHPMMPTRRGGGGRRRWSLRRASICSCTWWTAPG